MERLVIQGGARLKGALRVQGAKNSVLPLLAASVLLEEGCVLHNCPRLSDVDAAVEILEYLGCRVTREGHSIRVDPGGLTRNHISREKMQTMRSTILFLGPLLARTGSCSVYEPGGCRLGARPVDLHLMGLEALGAEITREEDRLCCRGRLRGGRVVLPFPSVGATENLILAALGAAGTTTIYNAAREPEIGDLIAFCRAAGARIYGAGTSMLEIEGSALRAAEHRVVPDRMEAATFLTAAAGTGGELLLTDARPEHLTAVLQVLEAAGCRVERGDGEIFLAAPRRLRAVPPIHTAPYPGFPTDAQAPMMAALLRADGVTVFDETVFSDRYRHVPGLRQLGAEIGTAGALAAVTGVTRLRGADMEATDLRGGAAMAVAALQAEGESRIAGVHHMMRGYENFAQRLRSLGCAVTLEADGA